jgi:hypothetical protein
MNDILKLLKKFGIDIVVRLGMIFCGILWILCILYILGVVGNAVADDKSGDPLKENIKQSIYEAAEQLMTCSSALRNTWSVYETIKDEKTGKEIKIHSIASDLQIYSSALYKEVNPQITDNHLDSILGVRNTIFATQLTPSERSEIVEECIELLNTLQGVPVKD